MFVCVFYENSLPCLYSGKFAQIIVFLGEK